MAFQYARQITIDHTLCGSADSTSFPVLISNTYPYLKTLANGGFVTNASGFDVGFYADPALSQKLPWETELYTASTGQVIYWVQVPTLSVAQDTKIYMGYGNTAITTDQSTPTTVWDANYLGVYHFGTSASLTVADSKNVNNGTNHAATATAQQINGGAAFSGASQYISAGVTGYNVAQAQPLTLEGWLKTSASNDSGLGYLQVTTFAGYRLFTNGLTPGKAEFQMIGASGAIGAMGGTTVTDGTRRRVTMAYDGSGSANGIQIYINGAPESMTLSNASATVGVVPNAEFDIGGAAAVGIFMTGEWDEVRVSKTARTASYDLASYNNQIAPTTFLSVGDQQSLSLVTNLSARTKPSPFTPGNPR